MTMGAIHISGSKMDTRKNVAVRAVFFVLMMMATFLPNGECYQSKDNIVISETKEHLAGHKAILFDSHMDFAIASPELGLLSEQSHHKFRQRLENDLAADHQQSFDVSIKNYSPTLHNGKLFLDEHLPQAHFDLYIVDTILSDFYRDEFIDLLPYRNMFPDDFHFFNVFEPVFNEKNISSIPYACDMGALYYRRDLLERFKMPFPPYYTYRELVQVAKSVKEGLASLSGNDLLDEDSDTDGILFETKQDDGLAVEAMEWVYAHNGGQMVDDQGIVTLNNTNAHKAFDEVASWPSSIMPQVLVDSDEFHTFRDFAVANRSIFMRNWSRFASVLHYTRDFTERNLAVARLPGRGMINGWGIAIPKTTRNLTRALYLANFLLNDDMQYVNAVKYGLLPTRDDLYSSLCRSPLHPNATWLLCSFFDGSIDPYIRRPAIGTGRLYMNFSSELSAFVVKRLLNEQQHSARAVNTVSMASEVEQLAARLNDLLNGAQQGSHCGRTPAGNSIGCQPGLVCSTETNICLPDVARRNILLALSIGFGTLFVFLFIAGILLHQRRELREQLARWIPATARMMGVTVFNFGDYRIPWQKIEVLDQVGEGSFGCVYKARYRGTVVAVKKLLPTRSDVETLKALESEAKVLLGLRHPNVVLFMGCCCQDTTHLAIVTEYMARGSLSTVLRNPAIFLSGRLRLNMMKDIVRGMAFLHSATPPMVHRDLKSPNILVDSQFRCKVSDFGLTVVREAVQLPANSTISTQKQSQQQYAADKEEGEKARHSSIIIGAKGHLRDRHEEGLVGSIYWTAPEVISGEVANEKSDVYSFGIICWEILSRLPVYAEMQPMSVAYLVVARQFRPSIPESCPAVMSEMIKICWAPKTAVRPTFLELMAIMENMKGISWPQEMNDRSKCVTRILTPFLKQDKDTDEDEEEDEEVMNYRTESNSERGDNDSGVEEDNQLTGLLEKKHIDAGNAGAVNVSTPEGRSMEVIDKDIQYNKGYIEKLRGADSFPQRRKSLSPHLLSCLHKAHASRILSGDSSPTDEKSIMVTVVCADMSVTRKFDGRDELVQRQSANMLSFVLRKVLTTYRGYELNLDEDFYMSVFKDVGDAVSFCLRVQQDLLKAAWPVDLLESSVGCEKYGRQGELLYKGIRLRMAIRSENIHPSGTALTALAASTASIAKRAEMLCRLGDDGQVLLSQRSYFLVRHQSDALAEFGAILLPLGRLDNQEGMAEVSDTDEGVMHESVYHVLSTQMAGREFRKLKNLKSNWL